MEDGAASSRILYQPIILKTSNGMTRWHAVSLFGIIIVVAVLALLFIPKPAQAPGGVTPTPASLDDLIVVDSPLPGATVSSPLTITGKARGNWYFEASFPVVLTDWDGRIITQGIAQAQGEWMTADYVPFTATLTFNPPTPGDPAANRGSLILKKDNPSGLPQNDAALELPVLFK